jgi:hypothetical protein
VTDAAKAGLRIAELAASAVISLAGLAERRWLSLLAPHGLGIVAATTDLPQFTGRGGSVHVFKLP